MITILLVLAGILVCILLSAYFSGSEMALSACNQIRLENEAEDGDPKAGRALRLAKNFDDTLSTILMGNNLVNIAASSLTTVGVLLLTGSDKLNGVGTLIITVLVILFGETVPKIVCKANATGMAKSVSGGVAFLRILFWPVTFVIVKLVHFLTKGIKEEKSNLEDEGSEELQTISGVGPSKANLIIDYRNSNGGFKKIEDIMNIKGIKEGLFNKIKDKITV